MSRRAGTFGLGALLAVACTPEVADDGISNGGTSGTAATHTGGYAGASPAGAGGAETQAGGGSGGAGSSPSTGGSAGAPSQGDAGPEQGGAGGSDVAGAGGSEHVEQCGSGGSDVIAQGGACGSNQGGEGGSDVNQGGTDQGGAGGTDDGTGGSDVGQGGSDQGTDGSDQGGSGGVPTPVCDFDGSRCVDLLWEECDGGRLFYQNQQCGFPMPIGMNCHPVLGCYGDCTNGETHCEGDDVAVCTDGFWVTQSCVRDSICIDGACSDCVPGETHCNGSTVERCDQNGHWEGSEVCDILCSDGACAGSCQPGTTHCNDRDLELCAPNGEWSHAAVCPNACVDGSCVGVCIPGSTRCSGTTVQTCSGQGQWHDSETCPFVCSASGCDGECVPGSIVCDEAAAATRTCGSSGFYDAPVACAPSPETADWHLVPACSEGSCDIACEEGYDDCDGNGSCTNELAADRNNCGICGHSCKGGTCSNGLCQQMFEASPIADRGTIVDAVVALDGKLYWGQSGGDQASGCIIEKSGTTRRVLVDAQNFPANISSNGGRVCWNVRSGSASSQGDIVCLDGGFPITVVSLQTGLAAFSSALHMNGEYAAWAGREATLSTGNVRVIINQDHMLIPYLTFVTNEYTYWVVRPYGSGSPTTEIRRSARDATNTETLFQAQQDINSMFVSDRSLVWSERREGSRRPRVLHMDLETYSVTLLHELSEFAGADLLTIHNGQVYWMETGYGYYPSLSTLMRMEVGDDDAIRVTDGDLNPLKPYGGHIAFDDDFAYWAEYTAIRKVPTTHWTDFVNQ